MPYQMDNDPMPEHVPYAYNPITAAALTATHKANLAYDAAVRYADAAAGNPAQPGDEDRLSKLALGSLLAARTARTATDAAELAAVAAARSAEVSWDEIGTALGMHGPNAHRKYAAKLQTTVAVRDVTVHLIGGPADGAVRDVLSGPDGLPPKLWWLAEANEASDDLDVKHVYERDGVEGGVWVMRWVGTGPV